MNSFGAPTLLLPDIFAEKGCDLSLAPRCRCNGKVRDILPTRSENKSESWRYGRHTVRSNQSCYSNTTKIQTGIRQHSIIHRAATPEVGVCGYVLTALHLRTVVCNPLLHNQGMISKTDHLPGSGLFFRWSSVSCLRPSV